MAATPSLGTVSGQLKVEIKVLKVRKSAVQQLFCTFTEEINDHPEIWATLIPYITVPAPLWRSASPVLTPPPLRWVHISLTTHDVFQIKL